MSIPEIGKRDKCDCVSRLVCAVLVPRIRGLGFIGQACVTLRYTGAASSLHCNSSGGLTDCSACAPILRRVISTVPRHSASHRIVRARPEQRGVATFHAFIAAAIWMFFYEAIKSVVLPNLSLWQSHGITILVSAITAAVVARVAMLRQSVILLTLAEEEARSERLELRQVALAESEARYRLLVEASPQAIAVHRGGQVV